MPRAGSGIDSRGANTSDKSTLTIASGEITVSLHTHVIAAETGTTDFLTKIIPSVEEGSDADGMRVRLFIDAGDTITIQHNQHAGVLGNILLPGGADLVVGSEELVEVHLDIDLDTNGAWKILGGSIVAPGSHIHHTKYTDAEAVAAVEAEDPLDLAGDVNIGDVDFRLALEAFGPTIWFENAGNIITGSYLYFLRASNLLELIIAGGSIFTFQAAVLAFTPLARFGLGIEADTIDEVTPTAGVTVDGLVIKDGGIHDADEDTSVWVEKASDEDIVRVRTAGVERVRWEANGDMQGNFIKMLDVGAAMVQATAPSTPADGQLWLDTAASGTGGLGVLNVTTITSNATLTTSQTVVLCDASSGAITVTLPAASGNDGRHYHIKKIDSSGNAVTIDGNGSETIDGETTQAIAVQYNSIQLVCDGSVWHIL